MSDKLFPGQHDDEEVAHVFRRHPIAMRWGIIRMGIFYIGGLLPYSFWFYKPWAIWVLLAGGFLGTAAMFLSWVGWYFTLLIVTDQRFIRIEQEGLFKRTVVDLGLDKIQNVNYQIAGLSQTLLGFGTIIVQTFVGDLVLNYIHHPQKVQQNLIKTIKDNGYTYSGEQIQD